MDSMFVSSSNFIGDLEAWYTSLVTSIMFEATSNFASDVSALDTSSVTSMEYMFQYSSNFATVEDVLQQDRKPFVDDRQHRYRSLVEGRMVKIMEQCWALQQKILSIALAWSRISIKLSVCYANKRQARPT